MGKAARMAIATAIRLTFVLNLTGMATLLAWHSGPFRGKKYSTIGRKFNSTGRRLLWIRIDSIAIGGRTSTKALRRHLTCSMSLRVFKEEGGPSLVFAG